MSLRYQFNFLKSAHPNNASIVEPGKPYSLSENAENFIGKTKNSCQPFQFAHDSSAFNRTFATNRPCGNNITRNSVRISPFHMQSGLVTANYG